MEKILLFDFLVLLSVWIHTEGPDEGWPQAACACRGADLRLHHHRDTSDRPIWTTAVPLQGNTPSFLLQGLETKLQRPHADSQWAPHDSSACCTRCLMSFNPLRSHHGSICYRELQVCHCTCIKEPHAAVSQSSHQRTLQGAARFWLWHTVTNLPLLWSVRSNSVFKSFPICCSEIAKGLPLFNCELL